MSELRMGVYRHYKGPLYQVLGLAHDANDEARTCVVYIALQLDAAHEGPRLAVRTLADFTAWAYAPDPDGRPAITEEATLNDWDAGYRPRFEYLGPEFKREMLP